LLYELTANTITDIPTGTILMSSNQKYRSVDGLGYFLKLVTDRYKLIPSFESSSRLGLPKNRHQNVANINRYKMKVFPKKFIFNKRIPFLSEPARLRWESNKLKKK
jgi:hypothetical protein